MMVHCLKRCVIKIILSECVQAAKKKEEEEERRRMAWEKQAR
jgi:hypothetical protein